MKTTFHRTIVVALLVTAGSGVLLTAASVDKALTEGAGRRKAAENGLREIKAKSKEQSEQVRELYAEAASRNNRWLELICQAIQQGASAAPDVSASVEPAASALVRWVSARNRALGVPELTPPIGDAVKKRVIADLTEIASETWKANRGANEQKRMKAGTALKERLQWRSWEEVH